tara:strand:- start:275 stop:616 length:342 start_codon:yes stop_codon:yes gene_type:complete
MVLSAETNRSTQSDWEGENGQITQCIHTVAATEGNRIGQSCYRGVKNCEEELLSNPKFGTVTGNYRYESPHLGTKLVQVKPAEFTPIRTGCCQNKTIEVSATHAVLADRRPVK